VKRGNGGVVDPVLLGVFANQGSQFPLLVLVAAAMKGGIEVLTRYMAKELGARRITVNVLAPGAIETDFVGGVVHDNKEVNKFLSSQSALGRVGLPDDIGGAVASLLADDNLWITGQRIEASCGTFH